MRARSLLYHGTYKNPGRYKPMRQAPQVTTGTRGTSIFLSFFGARACPLAAFSSEPGTPLPRYAMPPERAYTRPACFGKLAIL
jgi:hypothetical protein